MPAGYQPSLDGMARFVDQFLVAGGIERPLDVVGHDFGGPFAFAWAIQHADDLRRLVAINTAFHSDYRWHFWAWVWRTPVVGEIAMAAMNRPMFEREVRRGSGHRIDAAHIARTYAMMTPRMRKEVLRLYRATDATGIAAWEQKFQALTAAKPVLVIWGDNDPYIPARFAERFNARRMVHLADIGHWAPVEAPAACADAIAAFLSQ